MKITIYGLPRGCSEFVELITLPAQEGVTEENLKEAVIEIQNFLYKVLEKFKFNDEETTAIAVRSKEFIAYKVIGKV